MPYTIPDTLASDIGDGLRGVVLLLTDLNFLVRFLPVLILLYYPIGSLFGKGRWAVVYRQILLLIGSFLIVGLGDLLSLLILCGFCLVNYLIALWIDHYPKPYRPMYAAPVSPIVYSTGRKAVLLIGLLVDLSLLLVFKFRKHLPLGISYYVFTGISYLADVYRGKNADRSPLRVFLYLSFFPKFLQGPITRYSEMERELCASTVEQPIPYERIEHGLGVFILGLSFQTLLASRLGNLWHTVWTYGPYGIGTVTAWWGAWGYSMQLYYDFLGYTMMALGLAEILGFKLPDNFDAPYASRTMTSFWRRWHITLGKWFRDYLYIPLGGSRRGTFRMILALFLTWAATAVWHGIGWNFLIWGGFLFIILLIEKLTYGKALEKSFFGHIYMFILIPVMWMIFRIADLKQLLDYLARMFYLPVGSETFATMPSPLNIMSSLIGPTWWVMLLSVFFATPYPKQWFERFHRSWIVRLLLLALFILSIRQISLNGSNPFMYLEF